MRWLCLSCVAAVVPGPALAHDAFGDLGPFYASLLHPLADPLQAALLIGTAAFLARQPLSVTRRALPVFAGCAALAAGALAAGAPLALSSILLALAVLIAGLAALLPQAWVPGPATLALTAATGALTGLAPGPPESGALQPLLGTVGGIAALALLCWFALETAGRCLTPLVPWVAGSWVAAVGILVAAVSS
jgi:hypothetical protein